jgi:hypothetical protein
MKINDLQHLSKHEISLVLEVIHSQLSQLAERSNNAAAEYSSYDDKKLPYQIGYTEAYIKVLCQYIENPTLDINKQG